MSLQFLETALANGNVQAFLRTIRMSEGTAEHDGYSYLFGSSPNNNRRFIDFSKHPNIREPFGNDNFSTAAGAYQILYRVWASIQQKYNLPDFSPHSQDIAACELISEKDVLQKLMDGDFADVLQACSGIWASLPNNNYGQPEHSVATITNWYTQNGGTITS